MRRILFSTFILVFFLSGQIKAQTNTNEAIQYLNELFGPFGDVKKNTWKYLKAITGGKNLLIVEKNRKNLLLELNEQKKHIMKDKGFNSDVELRDAAAKYLDLSYTVLKEDYEKILDMEEIAEQSYDLMEAYMLAKEKANEKLKTASDELRDAETKFAEKYNITLLDGEDDKISKKIKKANDALRYYNQLYLIFFKCFKQEAYVIDAQNRNDVSAIEQNANTLASFAAEGLEKIKIIESYKGDITLKSAAKQIVNFYEREAKNDFPVIIDFYIKKDNFEKLEKIISSKKKKDITQDEADKYNKAVNDYNKAVSETNRINKKINEQRKKYFELWDNTVNKFFNKHTD